MAAITGSEGGGNYSQLKRGRVIGGDRRGLHGTGEGGGGVHGAVAREAEEAALGRHGEGGRKAEWAAWAERPNRLVGGWAD
jgi:hypothetical protein